MIRTNDCLGQEFHPTIEKRSIFILYVSKKWLSSMHESEEEVEKDFEIMHARKF